MTRTKRSKSQTWSDTLTRSLSTLSATVTGTQPTRVYVAPPPVTTPAPNTTLAPIANTTTAPTTQTAAPTPRPTLTSKPRPTAPPRVTSVPGAPAIVVTGTTWGHLSVTALTTGLPAEERRVVFQIKNGFFDPSVCQIPDLVGFGVPRGSGDVSFLVGYSAYCNYENFTISFGSNSKVGIGDDTDIDVNLGPVMMYNQSVTLKMHVVPLPVAASVTTTTTAAATASVGVAVIGGGAGGATGIQALGAMSLIACANPSMKGAMKGARSAIAPWDLGPEYIGAILGNFAILLIACALLGIATGGLYLKFKHDAETGKVPDEEEFGDPTRTPDMMQPLTRAMMTVGIPGNVYTVVCLTLQGIALESNMLLLDDTVPIGTRLIAAVFVLYSFSLPALFGYWMKKMFKGTLASYRYVSSGLPLPARALMPSQFWLPIAYANQHGTMFKTLKGTDRWFTLWEPIVKINITSLIAAIQAAEGPPCQAQFGSLAAVYVAEAIFRIVRWPQLTPIGNIGPLATCLTAALVASSQGFGVEIVPVATAMLLQSYLSLVCSILILVISIIDEKVWQKREIKARYLNNDFEWEDPGVVFDEANKELLKGKVNDEGEGANDGGAEANKTNPLLQVPTRATRGTAAERPKKPEKDAIKVPDSSDTLALLIAMKKEQEAVGGAGLGKTAADDARKKKSERRGFRPVDSDDSDDVTPEPKRAVPKAAPSTQKKGRGRRPVPSDSDDDLL